MTRVIHWLILLSSLVTIPVKGLAGPQISAIRFEGIARTDSTFLRRFLQSRETMPVDSQIIRQDCRRLQNLPYIIQAEFRIDSIHTRPQLIFELQESWSLFPIVNFGGIRGNFWMQLGASDFHALGKGIQVAGFYQLTDGRHGGQLHIRVPYLYGSKWGASFSALRWASTEPLFFGDQAVFYDYDNHSIGGTGSYEFALDHELELGTTFFVEEYQKDERHAGEVTPGPDAARIPKLLFKAHHRLSRINYHFYHLHGWDVNQYAQTIYDFTYRDWFRIYWVDGRYFQRFGPGKRLNLAVRCRAGLSENRNSPFAPFVLDSHVNIRGSGNRIDRGTGVLVCNTELRYAWLDHKQFASQAVVFSDLGTWRKPGGQLSDFLERDNQEFFTGIGARFIYKRIHNAIFRVDYGIDLFNPQRQGFVFGLGQYF